MGFACTEMLRIGQRNEASRSKNLDCTSFFLANLPSHIGCTQNNGMSMKRSATPGQHLQFTAVLENWAEGMDYCAVAVPADVTHALGTKGPVLVSAHVNDSASFQVSLFPIGGGKHYIRIRQKIRQDTLSKVGDEVRICFTVLDRADITIPATLSSALRAGGVTEAFRSLPCGKQNFLIRQINEAAKPTTRDKRIQAIVEAARRQRDGPVDQGG